MKAKNHPITAEHRAQYKAFLDKWQRALNLDDWRIEFADKPAPNSNMADVQVYYEHRLAVFRLGGKWRVAPTPQELERTAVHELLHVRLADIAHTARGKDGMAQEAAEHAVIVLFEKLLIPRHD